MKKKKRKGMFVNNGAHASAIKFGISMNMIFLGFPSRGRNFRANLTPLPLDFANCNCMLINFPSISPKTYYLYFNFRREALTFSQ